MKRNSAFLSAPLFVSVLFLLLGLSDKLLVYISKSESADVVFYAAILELFVFVIPSSFYLKIKSQNLFEYSKIKAVGFSKLPFILSLSGTFFFGSVIVSLLSRALFGAQSTVITSVDTLSNTNALSVFLCFVLIPAFSEEFLFRSILISDYSHYKGPTAIVISAFFFALMHFSFADLIFYFFTGILLGLLTYVTNSSVPSFILHLIYNCLTVYFGASLSSFFGDSTSSFILIFLLTVAFLLCLMSMLSTMEEIYEKRSIMYEDGALGGKRRELFENMSKAGLVEKKEKKKEFYAKDAFISPTLFVALVLFILITLNVI